MPTWPVSLPQEPLIEGYSEQESPQNVVRTEMEVGAAKVRRRATFSIRKLSFMLACTSSQVQDVAFFYKTTLFSGSLVFDWSWPGWFSTSTGPVTTHYLFTEAPRVAGVLAKHLVKVAMSVETRP